MSGRSPDPLSVEVGRYYDHEVALAEASGGGLIWFLGRDHLSPAISNEDDLALSVERWREAISQRVIALADLMGIGAGATVLDLGAGLGGPGRDIAAHTGASVSGVTLSVKQMTNLRRLSVETGSDYIDVEIADMQALPMSDESFDHVFAVNSIYHAPSAQAVISEAYRVLREGGRFGVDDWFATDSTNPVTYQTLRRNWSTKAGFHRFDEFRRHMREHGFRVDDIVDFTAEAAAFLSEERFGQVFDEQAAPMLLAAFARLWPDVEFRWAPQAVADLRRDILFMGELYRNGQAVYRQIVATK